MLWSVTSRRRTLVRDDVETAIHAQPYFLCVFFCFFRRRHRCRLYTCEICTIFCVILHVFFSGVQRLMATVTVHIQACQELHYSSSTCKSKKKDGREIEAEKDECLVFSQWICMLMWLVFCVFVSHKFWQTKCTGKNIRWQLCFTSVLLKLFDTHTNAHGKCEVRKKVEWEQKRAGFWSAYANKLNTLRDVSQWHCMNLAARPNTNIFYKSSRLKTITNIHRNKFATIFICWKCFKMLSSRLAHPDTTSRWARSVGDVGWGRESKRVCIRSLASFWLLSFAEFAYLFLEWAHFFSMDTCNGVCVCRKHVPRGFALMEWLYYVNIMILIIFSLFQHHEARCVLKHTFNLHAQTGAWGCFKKPCNT